MWINEKCTGKITIAHFISSVFSFQNANHNNKQTLVLNYHFAFGFWPLIIWWNEGGISRKITFIDFRFSNQSTTKLWLCSRYTIHACRCLCYCSSSLSELVGMVGIFPDGLSSKDGTNWDSKFQPFKYWQE